MGMTYKEWRQHCLDRGGMILPQVALGKNIAEKLMDIKMVLEYRNGVNVSYADVIRHIIMEHVKD